jgi:hypothetical protein
MNLVAISAYRIINTLLLGCVAGLAKLGTQGSLAITTE